ncbi:Fmp27p NDAI_0D00190 [Naumovozyma dairenensis CBS 421]|uniref:Uncharacterized protein n=1 Tax=Naumovozyma dairenensis (strain ATCC 10597 / BCRC 20456 / CBS 421 / NBRC 0211 / NRRL Y-12639) TaxID=1071378 RepID=G0W972_NAUDC|nr:hypothetical protein NDAI_0D00190 [Naumovozyma dairenensis CBS 421]CCD24333.1 hypothetical protein NDAI_0D00190 [Naumovozyma dairenensis CBS 421]
MNLIKDIFLQKWFLITIAVSTIIRFIIRYMTGIDIQLVNPFSCKFINVSYKGKFSINSIQLLLLKREIIIEGLTINKEISNSAVDEGILEKTAIKLKENHNKSKHEVYTPITLPTWLKKYYVMISNSLDKFHVNLENCEIKGSAIKIERFGFIIAADSQVNGISFDFYARNIYWLDKVLCNDGFITLKTTLQFENEMINLKKDHIELPFSNSVLDIKLGNISLSMSAIKKFKNITVSKSKLNTDSSNKSNNNNIEGLKEQTKKESPLTELEIEKAVSKLQYIVQNQIRTYIAPCTELNISIDKISFADFPITSQPKLSKINQFLSYHICASNFTFNVSRFRNEMPGFKLIFQEDDIPYKISLAFSRLNLCLNKSDKENKTRELLKIAEVPNISIFGESNLLSQKFEIFKTVDGLPINRPICNIKANIASPTIDVDIKSLSFLKSFLDNIKVFEQTFTDPMKVTNRTENCIIKRRKQILQAVFKKFLPIFNTRCILEDPKIAINDGENLNLFIFKFSALIFHTRQRNILLKITRKKKHISYESKSSLELLDMKLQHLIKDSTYKITILKIESISFKNQFKMLPESIFTLNGDIDSIEVDLSELPTMVTLNKIVRRLDCQMLNVEENYFKELYMSFASNIETSENQCSLIAKENIGEKKLLPSEFLFTSLPANFDYFKVNIRNIKIMLGSRSVFMPPEVFSSMESQSSHDLVDGKLRKFCFTIDRIQISLFGDKTQWHNKITSSNADMVRSGSTDGFKKFAEEGLDDISTSDATEVEHLWNINVLINTMSSSIIAETAEVTDELTHRVVNKVSVFSLKIFPETEFFSPDEPKKIAVQIENQKLKSVVSLMNIFLMVSGVHTLHQIFGQEITTRRRSSWAKKYLIAIGNSKKKSCFRNIDWSELKTLVEMTLSSNFITEIIILPNGLKTKLEVIASFITIKNMSDIFVNGEHIRMLVELPSAPNIWSRFVSISKYSISANIHQLLEQVSADFDNFENLEPAVLLENESWHFSIPHKFAMYRLIDNITTVVKSLKQLLYSLRTSKNDLIIFPKEVPTPTLPKITLKSNRCVFSVADDPIEAKLNMVFQIGLQEQRARLTKLEEFNTSVLNKVIGRKPDVSIDEVYKILEKANCSSKSLNQNKSMMPTPFPINDKELTLEEMLTEDIHRAYRNLQEHISDSWIKRIQEYKRKEREEFRKNFQFLWGNIDYSKLPLDINRKVIAFTTNPFLMTLIIDQINIDLYKPSCGTEGVVDFIHNTGNGVPKDTEYSIMIPMYIDAKFGEIRWHLRDYPLPFVYIPPLDASQTKEKSAIRLYGDFIVTEKLSHKDNALRTLFVPLVPSIALENTDTYYSLYVPRTVTSIKLYTSLKLDINSKDSTTVQIGNSYQPAIQQAMQCFDNFSKPPLDPSPKMGLWDKLRYIFHASVTISWKNNGRFELGMKSDRSPYKLNGKSAGFIIGFGKNVKLTCNEDADPMKNFLSCSADELYFSIPNHFAKPLLVWCRPSRNSVFIPNQEDTNLTTYTSYYYLIDLVKMKNESAAVDIMNKNYIEKTGIKLTGGTTLSMGIVLERLLNKTNERTFDSKKHYDINLTNPIYVNNLHTHDSYAGFRSDFIHMSFTLISNNISSYNAMQLSPNGLTTFFKWWKSFSGNFPSRRGTLFGSQSVSPKFGEHLYTISYSADVSPFFVAHSCHDIEVSNILKKNYSDSVEFAGLKAKASHFKMDLHQRKELVTEYQEMLDVTKRVKKLKFLEADIIVNNIDVRTLHGMFRKLNYIEEKEDAEYHIFDNDMRWLDIMDFQEAFFVDVNNYFPVIEINPMLYAPGFMYKKRASYGDKYQVDAKDYKPIKPFENKVSHNCILGSPVEIHPEVFQKRLDVLKAFEMKTTQELNVVEDPEKKKKLEKLVRDTRSTIKDVQTLLVDFNSVCPKTGRVLTSSGKLKYSALQLLHDSKMCNEAFENRYFIFGMLLQWNESVRDVVFKFWYYFSLSKDFNILSAQHSLEIFENIIKERISSEGKPNSPLDDNTSASRIKSHFQFEDTNDQSVLTAELLEMFERGLSELSCSFDFNKKENHYVQFITPQVQLLTKEEPDSCIIVSTPNILLKVHAFEEAGHEAINMNNSFLKRTGVFFTNANAFLFHKDVFKNRFALYFDTNSYGQKKGSDWPPWLGLELGFEPSPLQSEAIIKNLSSCFYYQKPYEFSHVYGMLKGMMDDKITVYVPKINISTNSKNYLFMYKIITNLLLYVEPDKEELQKQINKLIIGYDTENIVKTKNLVISLFYNYKKLELLENELLFKRALLDDVSRIDLSNIHNEKQSHLLSLYYLMNILNVSSKWKDTSEKTLIFDFNIKEVLIHMLHDSGKPFLDVAIAKLHLERRQSSYGFNRNQLTVKMMQIFNLERDVIYHDLLGPYFAKHKRNIPAADLKPLIFIKWEMDQPIGGIKVVHNVETELEGLKINIEEHTIKRIIDWLLLKESFLSSTDEGNEAIMSKLFSNEDIDPESEISDGLNEDLNEMIKRSSDYIIIHALQLNQFKLCISYKGKGTRRIANVSDFLFTFPTLSFANQTLRTIDILNALKRVLVRVFLRHTGKFIKSKLRRKSTGGSNIDSNSSLKPLSRYQSYTDVRALVKDDRMSVVEQDDVHTF